MDKAGRTCNHAAGVFVVRGPESVKRRAFVKAATAGVFLSTAPVAAPSILRGKRSLTMIMSWPGDFPGLGTSAQRVARHIETATDGQLTIKVHAAGELAGALETLDAVGSGKADIYHSADYYQAAKHPAFNFFTALPFGMTANEMAAWLLYGGGQALWDELSAKFNVKPFMCTSTGTQMGGWFNREINSLDDFKGLKLRMPGLGGEVLRRLGAEIVNLSGGEIYAGLQEGTVDAAEWVGPWNDLAVGLHKAAKHYYYPAFHEPGAVLALGINKDVWESFTQFQQNIVTEVTTAEYTRSLSEFNVRNAAALSVLREEHDVVPKGFGDEILKVIGKLSGEVLAEIGRKDALTERVYKSFMVARQAAIAWAGVGEEAFTAARRLDYPY